MSCRRISFVMLACFATWMTFGLRDLRADDAALVEKSISVKAIAGAAKEGEHLVESIVSTIQPHGWDAAGGRSTIKWQRGELVVSAPESVQAQIAKLVETLSELPPVNAKESATTPKLLRIDLAEADAEQPQLTAIYPVADLFRGPALATEAQTQIAELIESTVTPTDWAPVGGDGSMASFDSRGALVVSQTDKGHEQVKALLAALRKAPLITKEVLDKAPKDVSIAAGSHMHFEKEFVTMVYPVADLVTDGKSAQVHAVNGATVKDFDFDSLEELITSCITPTTWDAVGGSGVVREFDPRLVLVISHSKEVHKQVESLLAALRKLPRYSARPKRAAAAVPVTVAETKEDGESVQVVVYDVADRATRGADADFESLIEHLYGTDDVRWDDVGDGGFPAIRGFPARSAIVVFQTKTNQSRIVKAMKTFNANARPE
jgi:hypothetical protein